MLTLAILDLIVYAELSLQVNDFVLFL